MPTQSVLRAVPWALSSDTRFWSARRRHLGPDGAPPSRFHCRPARALRLHKYWSRSPSTRNEDLALDMLRVVNSLIGILLHCWRKHDAQEDCDRGWFGTGTLRRGGGPDTAQGRNHSHDGALWLKFHQHGHSYDTARPGRDLRQRSASVALHLGLRRGQAGSGACQGGHRLGRRSCSYLQAARRRLLPPWPQDDGRRHHLELQSHHGRQQGLSRRAFCPRDRGRGRRSRRAKPRKSPA